MQNATCQTTVKIYISQTLKYKRLCVCGGGGGLCRAENMVSAYSERVLQNINTGNWFMHLEHDLVFFCRHLWRSLDCNSVTKTTSLTSISTLISVSSTRAGGTTTRSCHADDATRFFPSARTFKCPPEFRFFFLEKLLTKVSYSCIYFFVSYNKEILSVL